MIGAFDDAGMFPAGFVLLGVMTFLSVVLVGFTNSRPDRSARQLHAR